MEEKKVSTLFEEMKDDLSEYVSNRLRLFKLQTYAKTSKGGAALIFTIIAILLILFAINFVFITVALYLGEILESMSLGFAIVALFSIIVVGIIIMKRKSIRRGLTNMIVSSFTDDDN
ncbi:MAG: phage holin family protein [Bacteroidales bacterium]|jgi:ammonia channel protein AmtB|nr:phage holin family protein [Bacteroidales bacterium]